MTKPILSAKLIVVLLLLMALAASGCSGRLYTHTNIEEGCLLKDGVCKETYKGVLYHPLTPQTRKFVRDRILDNEGNVTHHMHGGAATKCDPVAMVATVLAPDQRTHLLQYDSAFFETSKFTVAMFQNGALSSVGTESTPGGKALVESLEILSGFVTGVEGDAAEQELMDDQFVTGAPWCSHGELPAELLRN